MNEQDAQIAGCLNAIKRGYQARPRENRRWHHMDQREEYPCHDQDHCHLRSREGFIA
jgi:hypothetical protein